MFITKYKHFVEFGSSLCHKNCDMKTHKVLSYILVRPHCCQRLVTICMESSAARDACYEAFHNILYMDLPLLLLIFGKQKLGPLFIFGQITNSMFAMSTM